MSASDHCPECGRPTDGECRKCLVDGLFGEESEHFDLPETLGGFRLLERIGRGASGEVWKAFQPGPDREVALKVFLDPRLGGNADRSRFRAEAQALGKLDDPGIVPVYATGEEGGFLFIASRWMPGGTLAEHESCGRTKADWRRIARWVAKISRAVAQAHRHGLVHRDIKPANILLDEHGIPFLADFGIAETEGGRESNSTSGTPAYMAPEQARGEAVTTAADIYSLGALMFDLLTGSPPPHDQHPHDDRLAGLDRDLTAICLKCLREDPSERHTSALALAEDLEAWLRGEPVSARPIPPWARLGKWSKRHPALASMAVAVMLSAITLAVTLLLGSAALRSERNEAVRMERLAREQEQLATETAANFREHAYVADMYLASRALDDGQLGVAREMLHRHLPVAGEEDVRGFEWHAYMERCEGDEVSKFTEHDGVVATVAFSPSGRYLASGGWDMRVVVRDVDTGGVVLSLPRADAPTRNLEIPLMTRVLANSPELRGQVLRGEMNPDEFRMRGRPSKLGEITAVAFSPDGSKLVTASWGAYVRIWDFPSGNLTGVLPIQNGQAFAFSVDGDMLITLGNYTTPYDLTFHRMDDLSLVRRVHDVSPAFAVRGGLLAYQENDAKRMKIVRLDGFETVHEWPFATQVSALGFSPDTQRLIGLTYDGMNELNWSIDGTPLNSPGKPVPAALRELAMVGDGVAVAGTSQAIHLRHGPVTRLLRGHEDEITALTASADGKWIASASKDRSIRLWRAGTAEPQDTAHPHGLPPVRAHAPDGSAWLVGTDDGRVFVGKQQGDQQQLASDTPIWALAFSSDSQEVATWRDVAEGLQVDWWSVEDGSKLRSRVLDVVARAPRTLAVGGGTLAVTASDGPVEVFDLKSGRKRGELPDPEQNIGRLVVAPDGLHIAALHWPRLVRVGSLDHGWNPPWTATKGIVGPMVFSHDASNLISGNDENRIVIHNSNTGEELRVLIGHREPLVALALTPDGKTLVSSSKDRSVRLWHTPTWRELGVFDQGQFINYLGFSKDGKALLMGSSNDIPRLVSGVKKTPPP